MFAAVSRRSLLLWAAAALTAAAPQVPYLLAEPSYQVVGWSYVGSCLGNDLNNLIWPVAVLPFAWFGGLPLLGLAFTGWWLCRRTGRDRLGRVIARTAAGLLLVTCLPELVFLLLDATLAPVCLGAWGPPEEIGMTVVSNAYSVIPPLLVLLAVRQPQVRRGRLFRTVTAAFAVAALLLVGMERNPGTISAEHELDCIGSGEATVRWPTQEEKQFLCAIRGYQSSANGFRPEDPGYTRWARVADRDVLRLGRELCVRATTNGGLLLDSDGPSPGALRWICPAVGQALETEEQERQEENDAYEAKAQKACDAHPRHRPRIKPVKQVRATLWTEFWTIDAWEEGREGEDPGQVDDLVGGGPGALTIWAADEIGHACVTGESYTKAPPIETKGWEQVVEVPYESSDGKLVIMDGDGKELPDLITGGPGHYRVRVHQRGREEATQNPDVPEGTVELLIMVFPGKAGPAKTYK